MRLAIGAAIAMIAAGAAAADPLREAAFLPERNAYAPGVGPVEWRASEVKLGGTSVRINIADAFRTPTGLPVAMDRATRTVKDVDVVLVRTWTDALSFESGDLDVALSPHAGVGVNRRGGQAEAGAILEVKGARGRAAVARLKDMGVTEGTRFGDTGRWYLFAAASGRAVGLNVLRGDRGWDRAGWTTDDTGELVGDAQIGVGWRKGSMQSSFGVLHREVRGNHMIFGQETRDDTVAAFSLSIKPGSN